MITVLVPLNNVKSEENLKLLDAITTTSEIPTYASINIEPERKLTLSTSACLSGAVSDINIANLFNESSESINNATQI